jgi:excisionase family DNA binding protein
MNTAEAAKYIGLAKSTLYCYAHSGKSPAYTKNIGRLVFSVADCDAWLALRAEAKPRRGRKAAAVVAEETPIY